jgi:hypothetical protein
LAPLKSYVRRSAAKSGELSRPFRMKAAKWSRQR